MAGEVRVQREGDRDALKARLYEMLEVEIRILQTLARAVASGAGSDATAPLREAASWLAAERKRLSRGLH